MLEGVGLETRGAHTEFCLDPCAVGVLADLFDLEPLRRRGLELGAGCGSAGGQVGEHRPSVMRPLHDVQHRSTEKMMQVHTLPPPSVHWT